MGQNLNTRDGIGVTNAKEIELISKADNTEVLLMEVPMN